MPNLGGVYFVLLMGSIIATIYGVLEWLYNVHKKSKKYNVSFSEELKEEFRVVVDFSTATRAAKDMISMYSRNNSLHSLETLQNK